MRKSVKTKLLTSVVRLWEKIFFNLNQVLLFQINPWPCELLHVLYHPKSNQLLIAFHWCVDVHLLHTLACWYLKRPLTEREMRMFFTVHTGKPMGCVISETAQLFASLLLNFISSGSQFTSKVIVCGLPNSGDSSQPGIEQGFPAEPCKTPSP